MAADAEFSEARNFRGSRKHVLDWTEQFPADLLTLIHPAAAQPGLNAACMPRGHHAPEEARLETFGPRHLPKSDWAALHRWWLAHPGNTPNWDIALSCEIEDRPGIVLVEAKAHATELNAGGKPLDENPSNETCENHTRIGLAIEEARVGLQCLLPNESIRISRDSHYQLSNRLAFSWKLAALGLPTVLVYLGFLGDEGIRNVGVPFRDDAAWRSAFYAHADAVMPTALLERRLEIRGTPLWIVLRSRAVREHSRGVHA